VTGSSVLVSSRKTGAKFPVRKGFDNVYLPKGISAAARVCPSEVNSKNPVSISTPRPNDVDPEVIVYELNPTRASLLGFLHEGPMTGWDLLQTVQGTIGYFWNVTSSHVYRELDSLRAAGLIKAGQRGSRSKRPFTLTAKGRKAFTAWINQEPAQELIRFPLLVTMFFGNHLEPARLAEFVETHRKGHAERLEQYRRIGAAAEDADPYMHATLQFGMAYEEAALGWFDAQIGTPVRDAGGSAQRGELYQILRSLASRRPVDQS